MKKNNLHNLIKMNAAELRQFLKSQKANQILSYVYEGFFIAVLVFLIFISLIF